MSKYCSRFQGVLVSNTAKLFRGRCKQWDCDYCARENKRAWKKAIRKAIMQDDLLSKDDWQMLTFTMPPYIHAAQDPIEESAKVIQSKWNNLMMRIKRQYPKKKLTYVRVLENHKSGVFHIHMLINLPITSKDLYINPNDDKDTRLLWLKETDESGLQLIERLGFGHRQHCLMLGVDYLYAVNYVLKYIFKDSKSTIQKMLANMHVRRVQTSRNIKAPHSQNDDEWTPKYALYSGDFADQDEYTDLNKHQKITIDDLDEFGVYPPASERKTD